jgi:hypothetical protein
MKDSQWPPKGVHLRRDYRMPQSQNILNGSVLLPGSYGRETIFQTDFNSLDTVWKTTFSKSHERSSFQNEGKIENGGSKTYTLARDYIIELEVTVKPNDYTWVVIR